MTYRALTILVMLAALTGCNTFSRKLAKPIPLGEAVSAVQWAIDNVARHEEDLWASSKKELDHWQAECKIGTNRAQAMCMASNDDSLNRCKKICTQGYCTTAEEAACGRAMALTDVLTDCVRSSGKAQPEWCTSIERGSSLINCGLADIRPNEKKLCDNATACKAARSIAEPACAAAGLSAIPSIQSAQVLFTVQNSQTNSGELNVIVFSAGVANSLANTQTVDLKLTPRAKGDPDVYTLDAPATACTPQIDGETTHCGVPMSKDAQLLGTQLFTAIRSAIKSVSNESVKPGARFNEERSRTQNPMLLNEAKITFLLEATSDGNIGVSKEWKSVPAKIGFGRSTSDRSINSIIINLTPSK